MKSKVTVEVSREFLHDLVTDPNMVIPTGLFTIFLGGYLWLGHPLHGVADFMLMQGVGWWTWKWLPRWVDRRVEQETGQKQ